MSEEVYQMHDREKVRTQLAGIGIGLDMAGYHNDAQCIRDSLALLREQERPGWVSVQDRLPEREGLYLCWSAINGVEACYQIHLWKDGRWYWVHDVRYWIPLPEPPAERKTEEEDKTGWFSDESPTPAP